MEDQCPAQAASAAAKSSSASPTLPDRDLLNGLYVRLDRLIDVLENQNKMLLVMVDMNQQILEHLLGDEAEVPARDLAGRPLKL